MKKLKAVFVAGLLSLPGLGMAQQDVSQRILGVRVSDINQYIGTGSPIVGIGEINKHLNNLDVGRGPISLRHGAFVQSAPVEKDGVVNIDVLVLNRLQEDKKIFGASKATEEDEEVTVKVSADLVRVHYYKNVRAADTELLKSYYPGDLSFTAQVSLLERKLIFTDVKNNLKIVLPVGVGSLDEGVMNQGVTTLLTPRFKEAYLTREATISKRHKPRYFSGKPFIRIVEGQKMEASAVGFHTEINDSFVRGFDSHGCMRLRDEDLFMVHDLVKELQVKIPLTISYRVEDSADHPAPKRNKGYKRVQNVGTPENPRIILDRDNLMQTEYVEQEVPFASIKDEADDHYTDKYKYESLETYQRQREEDARICKEQVAPMPEISRGDKRDKEKAYEECIKSGARKLTLKDKLYRWWVH